MEKQTISNELRNEALNVIKDGSYLDSLIDRFSYYADEECSVEDHIRDLISAQKIDGLTSFPVKIYTELMPHTMCDEYADPEDNERWVDVEVMDNGNVTVYGNFVNYLVDDYSWAGGEYRRFDSIEDFNQALEESGYNLSWEQRPNFASTIEFMKPELDRQYQIIGGMNGLSNEELKVKVMEQTPALYKCLRDSEKTIAATVEAVGQNLALIKYVPDEDLMPEYEDRDVLKDKILDRAIRDLQEGTRDRNNISIKRMFELSYGNRTEIDREDPYDQEIVELVDRLEERCENMIEHDTQNHNKDLEY